MKWHIVESPDFPNSLIIWTKKHFHFLQSNIAILPPVSQNSWFFEPIIINLGDSVNLNSSKETQFISLQPSAFPPEWFLLLNSTASVLKNLSFLNVLQNLFFIILKRLNNIYNISYLDSFYFFTHCWISLQTLNSLMDSSCSQILHKLPNINSICWNTITT